jgi:hypothetical protein
MNTNTSTNVQPISEIKKETKGIHKIEKLYNDITYFSEYGSSVLIFSFLTLLLLLGCAFSYVMIRAQSIKADWPNQRCHPYVIPFAGFINKPDNMTMEEYTQQNFDFCSQTILGLGAGESLQPLTFVTNIMSSVANGIKTAIQDIRAVFNSVRTNIQSMASETMGRLLNMMVPLQQIFIDFRDVISKIEGTLTATIYSSLGAYYTFQSLMGAIVNSIITILIAMAATIITLWLVPFTWPVASSMSAIFISISVPLALIVAFITEVLHIKPKNPIPGLPSKPQCFDENTMIEMNDGSFKPISKIKIGEYLKGNNKVTSTLKLKRNNESMYDLHGVIVSDSHMVYYRNSNEWITIENHPNAKIIPFYVSPYLYCLNTSQKRIEIKNMLFLDWDEIVYSKDEKKLNAFLKKYGVDISEKKSRENIHKYLDGGLIGSTLVCMKNGDKKEMERIEIGDILEGEGRVIGIVEINGDSLNEQYVYVYVPPRDEDPNSISSLLREELILFEGGPNHILYMEEFFSTIDFDRKRLESNNDPFYRIRKSFNDRNRDLRIPFLSDEKKLGFIEKRKRKFKEKKLYHLIVDKSMFFTEYIGMLNYSDCIDFLLEN